MHSSTFSATAAILGTASLVSGQTFTDCNPLNKTCPADAGIGTTFTTDFTKGITSDWTLAAGTSMTYDGTLGANFQIKLSTDAPVVLTNKYIMFGHVTAVVRASPGTGTVSSFILESDDLDEIDWEWLGSTDTSVESNFFGKGDTTTYDRAQYHNVGTPIEEFHKYEIDWTADRTEWIIDGTVVRTLAYGDSLAHDGTRYPQTPMKVRMGNWIGCLDASDAATLGTCEWAGGQIDLTKGPFNMYVQSVTVEDYGCGGNYTYTDETGSYQSIKSSGVCNGKDTSNASSSASGSSTQSSSTASTVSAQSTVSTLSSTSSASASASAPTVANPSGVVGNASTTLSSTSSTATAKVSTSGTATASSSLAASSSSSAIAMKPKHQYGVIDFTVVALGLGLGYLIM